MSIFAAMNEKDFDTSDCLLHTEISRSNKVRKAENLHHENSD
mgnify:CR=1 FL=1